MKVLFVHQNFPAQYRYLASALAQNPRIEMLALGDANAAGVRSPLPGVRLVTYRYAPPAQSAAHPYARSFDNALQRGHAVASALRTLRADRFVPDVVYAHPGWGEALFVRDVYPQARITLYCEFFYRSQGADVGFDPEFPAPPDDPLRVRAKNAAALVSMEAADAGVSPTQWQREVHPAFFRERIDVIHDGIDTDYFTPGAGDVLELPEQRGTLTSSDEVVTYVARNLEPYRGFHTFMRALPSLQKLRPRAHVVIVGNDGVSYGTPPPRGRTHKEWLLSEVGADVDASRVHFLGWVPYSTLRTVYRISRAHVYLTYPFVLSWSMLEAMSCGCCVVASATAPVTEMISNGENGRLVDFFDAPRLAQEIAAVLEAATDTQRLREQARETVVTRFDLKRLCLPAQLRALGAVDRR